MSAAITINGTFGIGGKRTMPLVKGDAVNKVGAVSGWTFGEVDKTCLKAGLSGTSIVFLCQYLVAAYAESGDSGSPVFEIDAQNRRVILDGVLWGGSGSEEDARFVFSPISGIERDLGDLEVCEFCSTDAPSAGQESPDLVPEGLPAFTGPVAFCRLDDNGHLTVRVRNQTSIHVLTETTTRVLFLPGGPVEQLTSAIPGGGFADVTFPIPPGCFDSDCDFTIAVDVNLQIDENHADEASNHETNNIEAGRCIG